jgi:hypothetical protein
MSWRIKLLVALCLVPSVSAAQLASRLAELDLGPHAEKVRAVVVKASPAPRPASLEVIHGPGGITLVTWDHAQGRPGIHDLRQAWLIAGGTELEVGRDLHPIGVAPDGQSADLVREEGAITLRGDPLRTVGVLRIGSEDRLIYRLADGKLRAAWAPTTGELRNTVCGAALVNARAPAILDLAGLKTARPAACRNGLENLRRAALDVDPVVRDAEAALDALAPHRYYKGPGEGAGSPPCPRPTKDQRAAARTLIASAVPPPGGARPPSDRLRILDTDFGCVDPSDGSFLVRVLGAAQSARTDAVFSVTGQTIKRVFGWESTSHHEIHEWLEVDLDGDRRWETLVMRAAASAPIEWQIYRSNGHRFAVVPERWRSKPRFRPIHGPRERGLLIDADLVTLRNGALVAAASGFAEVRAAMAALEEARRTLDAHNDRFQLELYAELAGADGMPLPRAHPARVRWEQQVKAKLIAAGVPPAKIEPFLSFP